MCLRYWIVAPSGSRELVDKLIVGIPFTPDESTCWAKNAKALMKRSFFALCSNSLEEMANDTSV